MFQYLCVYSWLIQTTVRRKVVERDRETVRQSDSKTEKERDSKTKGQSDRDGERETQFRSEH